ncbi:MAG: response regulator [Candidatus Omnitrophota bacterium]
MGQKNKILIIDDEKHLAALIKLNLEHTGKYEVSIANDGEEGLRKANQESPHLIILDLILPKITGEEVCKKIRREEATEKIPIIMVTAKASTTDAIIGKVIGADHYMTKPFQMDDLLKNIEEVLKRQ